MADYFNNIQEDPFDAVDFDNVPKLEFEPTFESQQDYFPGQDIPPIDMAGLEVPTDPTAWAPNGPQQFGNEELYTDMYGSGDGLDGLQFQPQDPPNYVELGLSKEPHLEQSGLAQVVGGMSMMPSNVNSNINMARQNPPLSVDTAVAAAFERDWPYESDVLIPVSEQLPPTSPLDTPISTIAVNDGQPHTIQRRGSTPLITHGKIKRTTRRNKGEHVDPETLTAEYYGKPPPQKEPWGPVQKNGRPLFSYNRQGEVAKGRPFDIKEMRMYMFDPSDGQEKSANWVNRIPEPGERRRENAVRSGLTLWVGWTPAQVSGRYPSSDSNKCKFRDCAVDSRTIKTGDPRVVFDERDNVNGANINPFWNAAYAHLYCFEKHFNPVQLLATVDLRLDDRVFVREEQNLSTLKPDEYEACRKWFQSHWAGYCDWYTQHYQPAKELRDKAKSSPGAVLPAPAVELVRLWHESLTSRLMEKSLKLESRAKAQQRKKRREVKKDSCDRDTHRGDLDFANQARHIAALARNQRVKSHNQGEDFQREPPKVGKTWDEFQHVRQENQQHQWRKHYRPGMTPMDIISGTGQQARSFLRPPPPVLICFSPSMTLPAKRPREVESRPAPGGEDSPPIKRRRQEPGSFEVGRTDNDITRINKDPSHLWALETSPYFDMSNTGMQVGHSYGSQCAGQSADDTGVPEAYQLSQVHGMLPSPDPGQDWPEPELMYPFSCDQLQATDSSPLDASYLANLGYHGLPLCAPTPQDENVNIKEEETFPEFSIVEDYDDYTKVKSEVEEDVNIFEFLEQNSPPTSPGAPSSTNKRKRSDDGAEEESDVKADTRRRCSESSR